MNKILKNCAAVLLMVFFLGVLSCSPSQSSRQSNSDKKKPNIIFFIADDMYPEMFNCLPEGKGKNLTPSLDRLAAEGTLMTNQYVASPVCTPSRYNCLTGRYASRARNKAFLQQTEKMERQTVIQWNTFITEKDKALPHYLKELGYTTGMVGKNHVVEVNDLYRFPDYWADPQETEIKNKVEENYQRTVRTIEKNGFDYAGGIYHNNPNLISKLEAHQILDNTIIFFFNDHGQKAKGALYQGGVKSPSIVWRKGGFPVGNTSDVKVQNIDFAPTILELAGGEVSEGQFDGLSFQSVLAGKAVGNDRSLFFELGFARAIIKGDYKYYSIRYPEFAENWTEEERAAQLETYNARRRIKKMKIVNEDDPLASFSHFSVIPGGQVAENESYGKVPSYFDRDQLYNLREDPTEQNNLIQGEELNKVIYEELKNELKQHLSRMPGKFDL